MRIPKILRVYNLTIPQLQDMCAGVGYRLATGLERSKVVLQVSGETIQHQHRIPRYDPLRFFPMSIWDRVEKRCESGDNLFRRGVFTPWRNILLDAISR